MSQPAPDDRPHGRTPLMRLRVSSAAESRIRGGHPWVFSESVRESNRLGEVGELAAIYGRKDRFLAIGLFDPDSPIRVRILHRGKPCDINKAWFEARIQQALQARAEMFGSDTNGYRLINGESDGWPALVLDRYDSTCVLKLYSLVWLSRLDMVQSLLVGALAPGRIVLRLSRNIQAATSRQHGKADGEVLFGSPLEGPRTFLECGLRFEADVVCGQKTGFFLDQRENRRRVGELAGGRRVLNAFSFSGGFALYAARGGAKSVADLDISSHALDSARRNFDLNTAQPDIASCSRESIQADAFEWLRRKPDQTFDLVVLDPPSLARREAERAGAVAAYRRLVFDAVRWLARGGILFASSCSAHVTAAEFFDAVRSAARRSGRRFVELQTTGHASDHPATFPEAHYLKGIYLRF